MTLDKVIITLIGIVGIAFTYWFFFGKKEEIVEAKERLAIIVNGGYKPDKIMLKQGKTYELELVRTDNNSCLEEVVIPEFKIRKFLPLNEKVTISITPNKKGDFTFSCGMNMFHGKISVV